MKPGILQPWQYVTLNERWLAVRDDPLDATGRDFKEIRDHLLAVAVPVDPPGAKYPWERSRRNWRSGSFPPPGTGSIGTEETRDMAGPRSQEAGYGSGPTSYRK
ncbi:MAG: hypothetical protein RJR34_00010 [Candidatus Methanoculleus thermohydrogenotrophicum]|nr:hypothetical protein [Candidatus Methanoculleus thermohydrogenotrophicum]